MERGRAGEKQGKRLSGAELAKALESMKGTPLNMDFDELETPLRADIVEELHRILKGAWQQNKN